MKGEDETMKDTFYVIYGIGALKYFSGSWSRWTADRSAAKSYDTMSEVLEAISNDPDTRGPISVRRLTRIPAPGTTKRILLDHGDVVPTGAEIKFALVNPFGIYGSGCGRNSKGELAWAPGLVPDSLELFASETKALDQLRAFATSHYFTIRRVALITTEPTVEYKEEVVQ